MSLEYTWRLLFQDGYSLVSRYILLKYSVLRERERERGREREIERERERMRILVYSAGNVID